MLSLLAVATAATRVGLEADVAALDSRALWTKGARASSDDHLHLTFLLKQQNLDKLETRLLAASDPSDPKYGMHMSNEAVHALVAPSAEAYNSVISFLREHGVTNSHNATMNGDMISATVSVGTAEGLLGCEYHAYYHDDGTAVTRTAAYSLPAEVSSHVAAVAPTVQLPFRRQPAVTFHEAPDALVNTPKSLRKLYSVDAVQGQAAANKMAVTAFLGQRYSPGDFKEFHSLLMNTSKPEWMAFKEATNRSIRLVGDDGGKSLIGGTESMLDVEYSTALGANISTEFWGFKGSPPGEPANEPFLKWLTQMAQTGDASVPKVFSTSYGEDETSTSSAYAGRLNAEFMKAGARGISLLFASGDSGASGDHGCAGAAHDQFVAQWPAGAQA